VGVGGRDGEEGGIGEGLGRGGRCGWKLVKK